MSGGDPFAFVGGEPIPAGGIEGDSVVSQPHEPVAATSLLAKDYQDFDDADAAVDLGLPPEAVPSGSVIAYELDHEYERDNYGHPFAYPTVYNMVVSGGRIYAYVYDVKNIDSYVRIDAPGGRADGGDPTSPPILGENEI